MAATYLTFSHSRMGVRALTTGSFHLRMSLHEGRGRGHQGFGSGRDRNSLGFVSDRWRQDRCGAAGME